MLLTMLLVWGIVNVVLLCLWAGIVGFARRGVDEGRRAIRADLAFTVLALVFVMAGTSLANPSVRQAVGSVIQTTTGGLTAPRTPVQTTSGRATPHQGSAGRRVGPALGGSVRAPVGIGSSGSSQQADEGEAGAPNVGAPPQAANPVPPAAPPSEPAPVPSPPPSASPDPSPSCGDGAGQDPCPSPSDSPSPDGATAPGD